jgi:hypothetical protein
MPQHDEPYFDRRTMLARAGTGAGALTLGAAGGLAVTPSYAASGRGHRRGVVRWLNGYRRAWVRRDPDAAAALFTRNAVYQEHPFQPAYVGRAAIRTYWATVTATQSDIELRYGSLVVDGRSAALEWWANLRNNGNDVTLAGEFLLTFARNGLCRSLREYWFFAEGRQAPPAGWGE